MADVCPKCLMRFPHHLVVKARCTKRWRGSNFDAAAAQGAVGAAVGEVLGMSVRTNKDLDAFYHKAFVRAYGQGLDPNPNTEFDIAEGEAYEFHVGLRDAHDAEVVAKINALIHEAVAKARHFVLV